MQKRAPTLANILVIVLFALSCFGLLLFLWDSFGGPVPLKPKGYRFTVQLSRTLALAEQSDVRIRGVDVGHVVGLATHTNGTTDVTVEMDHQYAPISSADHMVLRQKTLLGETYIELLPPGVAGPGGKEEGQAQPQGAGLQNADAVSSHPIPDGGRLATSHVDPAVTLDDILYALDPTTRTAFKVWQQAQAAAFNGRGEQINANIAELEPFVENANKLVTILASQEGAVTAVVHNTGVLFDALTERDDQFRGFIVNGERTFHALGASSAQWANAFRLLPAFERGATTTLREFDDLATVAAPVLEESKAWERELTPLLEGVQAFTPDFNNLLTNLGPFTNASKKGLPAFERVLSELTPLLGNVTPPLRNFEPFLKFTGEYVPELQALFANATAATEAHDKNADLSNGQIQHYLRALNTVNPESLAVYSQRIGTNRGNPYFQPEAFRLLGKGGLQVFSTAACADSAPSANPETASATVPKSIIEQLIEDHVVNGEGKPNSVGAPACTQQPPFAWEGATSQFPQVTRAK
jgi:phospholipid/cholesterol/gamma-HCH transport system substrate-binding protein